MTHAAPITWNWDLRARPVAYVDFETASLANLKKVGSHAYVRDPSTRLLSAVWRVPGGETLVWVPRAPAGLAYPGLVTGDAVPDAVSRLASSHTWIAHNAEGFDAQLWSSLYPSVRPAWADTMPLCRVIGLPASLDAASRAMGGAGKDAEGSKVMRLLTSRPAAVGTVPLYEKLLRYNEQDVSELERLAGHVAGDVVPRDLLRLHSEINERGVYVDRDFAARLHAVWLETKAGARDEIAIATGGKLTAAKASSGPAVHAWLRSVGINLASLRKDFLAAILDDPESLGAGDDAVASLVSHVLRLRADVVRAGEGKVARLVDTLDPDSRLRRMLTFHGAGPGRWSSRVVQLQNLPKGVKCDVEGLVAALLTPDSIRDAANAAGVSVSDTLASLVRPCFAAPEGRLLAIADFASVEARCAAWMAGCEKLLTAFREGRDPYCEMASVIFGRPITKADTFERSVGKELVLGAMYGLGGPGFLATCKKRNLDLGAAGASCRDEYERDNSRSAFDRSGRKEPFDLWFAKKCIKSYRNQYPEIPALWRKLGDTLLEVVRTGATMDAGRTTYQMRGPHLYATLSSGRSIVYRDARIVNRIPRWAVLQGRDDIPPADAVVYTHPMSFEKEIWHGVAIENASQGTCRDLLAESMLRYDAERPGEIVMHVHDEIVAESPRTEARDAVHTLARVMSTVPAWASGFPCEVEAFTGPRYTKSPFRDAVRVHYRGGVSCAS